MTTHTKYCIVKYLNRYLIQRELGHTYKGTSCYLEPQYLAGNHFWWSKGFIENAKRFRTIEGAEKFLEKSLPQVVKTLS